MCSAHQVQTNYRFPLDVVDVVRQSMAYTVEADALAQISSVAAENQRRQ